MNYFPMFLSLENRKILIVGAGKVASNKVEKLLEFTNDITILAPNFDEKMNQLVKKNELNAIKREYKVGDIKGFDIVVAAIDSITLQKNIYMETKEQNVLCNCVDIKECCDFIFPSYIKEGDLTISISTNGTSPAFAKSFKKYLQSKIPNDVSSFLENMKELRVSLPKGENRMKLLDDKVKEYIKSWT